MSVDVLTSIVIERPREEVSAFAADPANAPAWYVNIKSVEWKTSPVVQVGSKATFVAHFLGRRLEYTYEIVEYVPSHCLTMRTAQGPFPMRTAYTWESEGEARTKMTLRNSGQPAGFSSLLAPIMSIAMHRANTKDLASLKLLLEGNAAFNAR